MSIYLLLFWEFFKIGLFAVGGAMSALPFIYDLADKYDWFTAADATNMIAISESTPGPITINLASYVGYTVGGFSGSLIASLGVTLPPLIITVCICRFLQKYRKNPRVEDAFYGLRPAIAGMIAAIGLELIDISVLTNAGATVLERISWPSALLFAGLLAGILKFKKHPVLYIAVAALLGIVFKF